MARNILSTLSDVENIKSQQNANALSALKVQNAPQEIARQNQLGGLQVQTAQNQVNDQQLREAYAAAQYIIQSPNPKQMAESQFPDIVNQLRSQGVPLNTDDDVRQAAQYALAHFGSQAGIVPPPQLQTIGNPSNPGANGVLQRNPQTGAIQQIVAPQRVDPLEQMKFDEQKRHNQATEQNAAADPQSVEQTARMIAANQIPMISGFALKTPWGQQVVARVGEISPDYQGGIYNSKSAAMRNFSTGAQGNTVRSLNVAISHLGTLGDLASALDNGNVQALNRLGIAWKTQTGEPAPSNFISARDIVANEVVKAVTASGGGVSDRQEAQAQIQAAASPAQLAGVIKTWKQLLSGQLGGLKQQYEQGTGQKDFERFLSNDVKTQIGGESGSAPAAAEQTATGPNGQKIVLRNGQWVPLQ